VTDAGPKKLGIVRDSYEVVAVAVKQGYLRRDELGVAGVTTSHSP
jgi:hypothetical protein